jgi:hypothetical protein
MKKTGIVGLTLAGVLGLGGAFYAGSASASGGNPLQDAIMSSAHSVANHGTDTVTSLTTNTSSDLKDQIESSLSGTVGSENDKVDQALQDYYQQKLVQAATGDTSAAKKTLDTTANNAITNGEKAIDEAFAQLLGN